MSFCFVSGRPKEPSRNKGGEHGGTFQAEASELDDLWEDQEAESPVLLNVEDLAVRFGDHVPCSLLNNSIIQNQQKLEHSRSWKRRQLPFCWVSKFCGGSVALPGLVAVGHSTFCLFDPDFMGCLPFLPRNAEPVGSSSIEKGFSIFL